MTKQFLPLVVTLLLSISTQGQSPWEFPALEEVMAQFYRNYQFTSTSNVTLNFARKDDGWYVTENDYTAPGRILKEDIFWSTKTMSFLPLHYERVPMGASTNLAYHIRRYFSTSVWSDYNYSRCVYYGYPEWANDMRARLAVDEELSSRDLEGLARAYDFLANQLLHASYGLAHENYQPLEYQRLADGQRLDDFLRYSDSSLILYQRLADTYPDYPLLVGSPALKLTNQTLSTWHSLIGVKREDLASAYLPDGLYDTLFRSIARLQLNGCPPNALFLAQGDNDYFPLLYLQQTEGLRQDVTILNMSLLNAGHYLQKASGELAILFSSEDQDQLMKGYVVLPDNRDTLSVPLPGGQKWQLPSSRSGYTHYLNANQFFLSRWLADQSRSSSPTPLCISVFSDPQNFPGLFSHLVQQGLVFRLASRQPISSEEDPLDFQLAPIDQEKGEELIENYLAHDQAWLYQYATKSNAHFMMARSILKIGYSVMYEKITVWRAGVAESAEWVKPEESSLRWLTAIEPLFERPDPKLSNEAAQSAILAYRVGAEELGSQWEKRLYECLDQVNWSPETSQSPDVRTGLSAINLLGYYFQENDRELQLHNLEQQLAQIEAKLEE